MNVKLTGIPCRRKWIPHGTYERRYEHFLPDLRVQMLRYLPQTDGGVGSNAALLVFRLQSRKVPQDFDI